MKNIILTVSALFGLILFQGCFSMTGRTAGEHMDDSSIVSAANTIVIDDHEAKYFKIDVSSTAGDVVLTGFIHDREAEKRILAKIQEIHGVKSVKSHLHLEEKKWW